MQRVMITGGGGFIARNLKEYLKDQYCVYAPTSKELDICDSEAVDKYIINNRIELVIHTAHVNQKRREMSPANEVEINLRMFFNLEKHSKNLDKIIYFGSGAEFDKRFDISMAKEEDFGKRIPDTPYGISKYTKTQIARGSDNIYNLRNFGVFGKYEDWKVYFISNLCCKALYDLPLTIRQDCLFDYLYIDDMCKVVEWFIENKPQYHDYNVCSGQPILLSEIAQCINKISGKELPIVISKPGRNLEYTGSNSRLMNEYKELKLQSIEKSIKQLYTWYSKNIDTINYSILKETR